MWAVVMFVSGVLLWEGNLSLAFPPASPSTASSPPTSSVGSLPPSLLTLLHDLWHWRTQESPEFATQVGINDNTAGRLDSFSKERFQRRKDHCQELLRRAENTPTSNLTFEDQINLKVFKEQIQSYIVNFRYLKYFIPVTSLEGPQLHLQHLVSGQMTLESYNDFQKLLARYGEFPRQIEEILEIMRHNLDTGIMPHNLSMAEILDQFSSLDVPVVDSAFFKPFLQIPLSFPPEQRRTLRQQAQERISQDLLPAFEKLKYFLKENYLNGTRNDPGVNSLPGGDEYYAAVMEYYTSTKLTPQEIHALGLTEIRRLQESLLEIAGESEFPTNATLEDILKDMRESSKLYFSSKEELIEAIRSTVFSKLKNLLPSVFNNLPIDNLTIDGGGTEKMKRGRPAWYESPSLDGARPGKFHIDAQELSQISKHEVVPLSLHLSYPGQHLHAVYLQVSSTIPAFRKVVEASHWSLVPAEFSYNPAFVEGWALYSEFIGEEIGLYDTPLKKLVKIARELATASMLVIDTGIHAMGWSIESATNFLMENTALSPKTIKDNLKRIVTWPAQACSAKVGEIKLKELRQRAQNALGKSFRLQEFHEVLLQCTNALPIVQNCVTHYISEKIRMHEEEQQRSAEKESEPVEAEGKINEIIEDETSTNDNNEVNFNNGCQSLHKRCWITSSIFSATLYIFILIYCHKTVSIVS